MKSSDDANMYEHLNYQYFQENYDSLKPTQDTLKTVKRALNFYKKEFNGDGEKLEALIASVLQNKISSKKIGEIPISFFKHFKNLRSLELYKHDLSKKKK